MTASALLLGAILLACVSYLAVLPVLMERQHTRANRSSSQDYYNVQDLQARYHLLLASIHDLDFDYDTGKISVEVYAEQRKMLIGRCISALMQLDKAEATLSTIDDKIEAAVEAWRHKSNKKEMVKSATRETSVETGATSQRRKVVR